MFSTTIRNDWILYNNNANGPPNIELTVFLRVCVCWLPQKYFKRLLQNLTPTSPRIEALWQAKSASLGPLWEETGCSKKIFWVPDWANCSFPDSKTCYLHERNPGVVLRANRMQFQHPWGPQYGSTYHPGQSGILQESGNHTTAHSAGVNQQSKFGRSKNCLAPIGSGATRHSFGARQVTRVCVYINICIYELVTYIYIYTNELYIHIH